MGPIIGIIGPKMRHRFGRMPGYSGGHSVRNRSRNRVSAVPAGPGRQVSRARRLQQSLGSEPKNFFASVSAKPATVRRLQIGGGPRRRP